MKASLLEVITAISTTYVSTHAPRLLAEYTVSCEKNTVTEDTAATAQKRIAAYIDIIRTIFETEDEYVVFGSLALYLCMQQQNTMQKEQNALFLPHDFDVFIFGDHTYRSIVQKLQQLVDSHTSVDRVHLYSGASLSFDPSYTTQWYDFHIAYKYGKEETVFQGEIFVNTDNSDRIIDSTVLQHTAHIEGLRVLNMHGLQKQVQNNLRLEITLEDEIQQYAYTLTHDDTVLQQVCSDFHSWKETNFALNYSPSSAVEQICTQWNMRVGDLAQFYYIQSLLQEAFAEKNVVVAEWCIAERARVFGGIKTKVAKRLRNLELLNSLVNISK